MVRTRVAAIEDPSGRTYWQKDLHIASSKAMGLDIQGVEIVVRSLRKVCDPTLSLLIDLLSRKGLPRLLERDTSKRTRIRP